MRRWALTGLLAAGVVLGAALLWRGLTPGSLPGAPLPSATFDRRVVLSTGPSGGATTEAAAEERALPTYGRRRLGIPSLGVDAPVLPEPVGRSGELVIPGDPKTVGRWDDGPDVDAAIGTTVLAGHVSVSGVGDGALRDLYRVGPGELVLTTSAGGAVQRWRVDALLVRHKDDLPSFATDGPRRLAIVTCGGRS